VGAALAVGCYRHPFIGEGIETDFTRFAPGRQGTVVSGGVSGARFGGMGIVEIDQLPAVGEPGAGNSRHETRPVGIAVT
jgi:hypothetical protein